MTVTATPAAGPRPAARAAADSRWLDRLARLGLAARGLVYVVIGGIAVDIATGSSHTSADRQGALRTIASTTLGKGLVVVAAVGFLGYALWRASEAVWGHRDADGAKRTGKRLFSAFRAGLYGWFAVSAVLLLAGSGGGGSSDRTSRTWTARAMREPFGRYAVMAAGVGFIVVGLALVWRGLAKKFEKKLATGQMSRGTRKAVEKLGMFGNAARGVVFDVIGVFLIVAAATFDPHRARGLDGSLRALAHHGWGQFVLGAVALGLVAYGLYSFAEARYRRT